MRFMSQTLFYQVARDKILKEWKFLENIEFSKEHGSGYPSGKTFLSV